MSNEKLTRESILELATAAREILDRIIASESVGETDLGNLAAFLLASELLDRVSRGQVATPEQIQRWRTELESAAGQL